jgi:hypothetical protein
MWVQWECGVQIYIYMIMAHQFLMNVLLDTYWSTFDGMRNRFDSILLWRSFLYKLKCCNELHANTNENHSLMSLLLAVIALSLIVFIPSALEYTNYISQRTL